MYKTDSDKLGSIVQVYFSPEGSPTVSICPDDVTDSAEESECEDDSEYNSDVDICMEDNMEATDGIDLDGHVNIERDSDDEDEEGEAEEGEEKQDEVEEDDDDEDEDDGKDPWTIGQGEMENTSADDVDTIVDDQILLLPEQLQDDPQINPTATSSSTYPTVTKPEASPKTTNSGN